MSPRVVLRTVIEFVVRFVTSRAPTFTVCFAFTRISGAVFAMPNPTPVVE